MSAKITVPTLGESVTEATVDKWLKSQGDQVIVDEPIVELETDKVKYIGRNASASTATGNLNKHLAQQKEILEKVVGKFN